MKAKNQIRQAVQKYQNFLLEMLFPESCFICKTAGKFLCPDCAALCEVAPFHSGKPGKHFADSYAACWYGNKFVKQLVGAFKYEPFLRRLSKPLAGLIASHFDLLDEKPDFSTFVLVPVPLSKQRLRWRGYNQSLELAKDLAGMIGTQLSSNCLIRTKNTDCQVGLSAKNRLTNIAGAFECPNPGTVFGKNILLVDDVITTGATIEECAMVLKQCGAKEIITIAIARADINDA